MACKADSCGPCGCAYKPVQVSVSQSSVTSEISKTNSSSSTSSRGHRGLSSVENSISSYATQETSLMGKNAQDKQEAVVTLSSSKKSCGACNETVEKDIVRCEVDSTFYMDCSVKVSGDIVIVADAIKIKSDATFKADTIVLIARKGIENLIPKNFSTCTGIYYIRRKYTYADFTKESQSSPISDEYRSPSVRKKVLQLFRYHDMLPKEEQKASAQSNESLP